MNSNNLETGYYRIVIDSEFTVAELEENGVWRYIEGDFFGNPDEVLDKISEQRTDLSTSNAKLSIKRVSSCLIQYIKEHVKIQREIWGKDKEWDNASERYTYGRYLALKELSDGIDNGFFNNC